LAHGFFGSPTILLSKPEAISITADINPPLVAVGFAAHDPERQFASVKLLHCELGYSNPFAFMTATEAGEDKNLTNALPASGCVLLATMPAANCVMF
jgi:hypothetical protein